MSKKLFYLQNGYLGNAMAFWKKGHAGYTTDLNKAHVFTEEQAFNQHSMRDEDIPWPKDYLDKKAGRSVDVQHVDYSEAFAEELEKPAMLHVSVLCRDCPPEGYPTDETRCAPCPRRKEPNAPYIHG